LLRQFERQAFGRAVLDARCGHHGEPRRCPLGPARPIQLVHLPVPIARDDDAYFAPLRALDLGPETTIALGLVHLGDGIAGTQRRIATAQKHLGRFALGTECGLSHVGKNNLLPVLRLHAEIAAAA
jgi:hypothetical protein